MRELGRTKKTTREMAGKTNLSQFMKSTFECGASEKKKKNKGDCSMRVTNDLTKKRSIFLWVSSIKVGSPRTMKEY